MPPTPRSENASNGQRFIGVDGCRGGWIAAGIGDGLAPQAPVLGVFASFNTLLRRLRRNARFIAVDVPIGLSDHGRRGCDGLARRALGPRGPSVFPAPRRPMLAFSTYAQANAWGKAQGEAGGGGLSKQAWNILPKIREVDRAMTPAMQAWTFEAHPEVAFMRLGRTGAPAPPKRTAQGRARRLALLADAGLREIERACDRLAFPDGVTAGDDDILDACALALTAAARAQGQAIRLSDGARDANGLVMEIWG